MTGEPPQFLLDLIAHLNDHAFIIRSPTTLRNRGLPSLIAAPRSRHGVEVLAAVENGDAGRWFYDQVKKWDGGACVHMFRKTSLQYARGGQDATRSLARDARVTEAVMMTHYVKEEDLQLRAASNAMYRRLRLSISPEVARAFGHEHFATAILEQRLRDAIGSRNWPLVGEVAKKLAKQDSQAG